MQIVKNTRKINKNRAQKENAKMLKWIDLHLSRRTDTIYIIFSNIRPQYIVYLHSMQSSNKRNIIFLSDRRKLDSGHGWKAQQQRRIFQRWTIGASWTRSAARAVCFSCFAIPSDHLLVLYCIARARARSKIWYELFHVKHARARAHAHTRTREARTISR